MSPALSRHGGQAVVEAILALAAVGSIWLLGALVGRLQDLALHTGFAGRHLAFAVAQDAPAAERARAAQGFSGVQARQWRNHDGSAMLRPDEPGARVDVARTPGLSGAAQVGATGASLTALRADLLPAYQGMVSGKVSVAPRLGDTLVGAASGAFEPVLSSRFAILVDAGHAHDDRDAQVRIAAAPSAWGSAAQETARVGRALSRLGRMDAAWQRPLPQFDWLSSWAGLVPEDRLSEGR